jgi:hypothetical protein
MLRLSMDAYVNAAGANVLYKVQLASSLPIKEPTSGGAPGVLPSSAPSRAPSSNPKNPTPAPTCVDCVFFSFLCPRGDSYSSFSLSLFSATWTIL